MRRWVIYNTYLLMTKMQLNIISQYLYIVNNALINWGGLSDGCELVAEEIYWFGQGWNSPSHKRDIPKNMLNHCYKAHRAKLKSKYDLLVYFTVKFLRIFLIMTFSHLSELLCHFVKLIDRRIFFWYSDPHKITRTMV